MFNLGIQLASKIINRLNDQSTGAVYPGTSRVRHSVEDEDYLLSN